MPNNPLTDWLTGLTGLSQREVTAVVCMAFLLFFVLLFLYFYVYGYWKFMREEKGT